MMPMNQSMLPYFMQMMLGGGMGNGMPQMQNAAPQLSIQPAIQRSSISQIPQMPQQQRPQGGAVGQAAGGVNNMQTLGKAGTGIYNAAFGSTPQSTTPNPISGATGNNPMGIQGTMPNNDPWQPSSPGSTMGFDPNAGSAQPGMFQNMANNMGAYPAGFDQAGNSGYLSGMTGPSAGMDAGAAAAPGSTAAVDASASGTGAADSSGIWSWLMSL